MDARFTVDLTTQDYDRIRILAGGLLGINLSAAKRDMVYGRLRKRLRQLGMTRFDTYCDLLETRNAHELEQFTNAITTNLTSFFRQQEHFEYLAKTVLPEYVRNHANQHRLRFWSAGCSTGEEPYSIAMTLLSSGIQRSAWDVRILATDIDSNVLAKAKAGQYRAEAIRKLAREHQQWMTQPDSSQPDQLHVSQSLREMIVFKPLNLLQAWPFQGPFDCIFCRNVVIYFNKETQRILFDRFAQMLPIGGYLFIGFSELLYKVSNRFELIGKSIYRRVT